MKYLLLHILLFTSLQTYSQIAIKNISIVKPEVNILYQHVDNRLKISGTNTKVNLISKNGFDVSHQDSNTFVIIPKTLKPDTLLVYSGKKLLLTKVFSIDTVSLPKIQLGNIQNDTASVSEILANRGLRSVMKGCLYNFSLRILGFSMTFIGNLTTRVKIIGNMISKDQETMIRSLRKGDKILFDDIAVVSANSRVRELPPFTIVVK
jgi:hypothetical protein